MSGLFFDWLDDNVPCEGEATNGLTSAHYRQMLTANIERKGLTLADLGLTAKSAEKYISEAMAQSREEASVGIQLFIGGPNERRSPPTT